MKPTFERNASAMTYKVKAKVGAVTATKTFPDFAEAEAYVRERKPAWYEIYEVQGNTELLLRKGIR